MKYLVLFWLLLTTRQLTAQANRTDSLWLALKNHPQADTFRVNRLNDLTSEWGLAMPQYDSLAKAALALSQKIGYKTGQARALFTLGTMTYSAARNDPAKAGEMKQGQQMLDQAIQLAEQSGDKRLLISLLNQVSSAKRVSNTEKKQALTYAQRALSVARSLNDASLVADCQRMIAYYYDWVDGNYAAALQWNFQALQTARQSGCRDCALPPLRAVAENYMTVNDVQPALRYLNQTLVLSRQLNSKTSRDYEFYSLSSIASLYKRLGRYPEALRFYEQAVRVRQRDYPQTTMAYFDRQTAAIYELQGRYPEAITLAQRGLKQARQDHNAWGESAITNTLSRAYLHTGRLDSALVYGNQSYDIARQTRKKDYIRDASQTLADVYARRGSYADAYRYQTQYYAYRDSLTNEEVTRKTTAAQFTYQIGQQKSQLKLQAQQVQQQRFQRNVLFVGALVLLLLGGAVAAWLLNRAKVRRLEEAQALRKRIAQDLHDEVGSTLSSISLLSGFTDTLLTQNRSGVNTTEKAQQMVQKIYADARHILESIDEIIWTINPGNDSMQRIIMRLQEYARPLMESRDIRFSFESDPALADLPVSMEIRRNLYLITKEAINNLVKYSEATQATVRFTRQDKQVCVVVEDNGRGFDPQQESSRSGQASMKERAEAMAGSLQVDSVPNAGTALRLSVPIG